MIKMPLKCASAQNYLLTVTVFLKGLELALLQLEMSKLGLGSKNHLGFDRNPHG